MVIPFTQGVQDKLDQHAVSLFDEKRSIIAIHIVDPSQSVLERRMHVNIILSHPLKDKKNKCTGIHDISILKICTKNDQ